MLDMYYTCLYWKGSKIMEADVFVSAMEGLSNEIEEQITMLLREAAHVLVAEMKQRVIQSGENSKGGKFSPYSTKTMLVSPKSFKTSAALAALGKQGKASKGLKGKRGVRWSAQYDWRTVNVGGINRHMILLEGGYKKFRELHGHPTANKIFYWDGTMMNSIMVGEPTRNGQVTSLEYGPNIGHEVLKMAGNSAREGMNIEAPSEGESQKVIDVIGKMITNRFK